MIVCEVGLNHLGSTEYSLEYAKSLSSTQCDAVTYQIRENEFYKREKYRNYELSFAHYSEVKNVLGKKFGFALSNIEAISDCESLKPDFYKLLSWEINNYLFVDKLLEKTNKPIYFSLGTSSQEDLDKFHQRYGVNYRINFIHTQLSKNAADANLKAIKSLQQRYPYQIGFGNHCEDLNIILAALAFEVKDVWFYVKGADYNFRFHPDEFWAANLVHVNSFISTIKNVQKALGDGTKSSLNTKGY